MDEAIIFKGITKRYGKTNALADFSLTIPQKSIFFIIGLNGAGKTTLLKSLVGHISIDEGEIGIYKKDVRMAAMIEMATFNESLSGYQNMMHTCILRNGDKNRINNLLHYVGLNPQDKKAVKKYSLGMRQRLRIAMSLLISPEILILDEPFNGLDPEGINQIKSMIIELNNQYGVTVLLSSHLIRETEGIATHYAIIDSGKLIKSFDTASLQNELQCYEVRGENLAQLNTYLKDKTNVYWDHLNKRLLCFEKEGNSFAFETLKQQFECELNKTEAPLDAYFLAIVGGEKHDLA